MKKMMVVAIILALMVMCLPIGVFAGVETESVSETEEQNGNTRYTYFGNTVTSFYISGGVAKWTLTANKTQTYDTATVTAQLYKKNSGLIVTYVNTFYNSNLSISRSRTMPSSGSYYVKFTIKCYKNGQLKETISITTVTDTY